MDVLHNLFAESRHGVNLGIAGGDQYSQLTTVPSVMKFENGQGRLYCDIRFPVTHKAAYYYQKIADIAQENDIELLHWQGFYEPLLAERDSEIVTSLTKAYRDYTGDNSEPMIIGSSTYAKCMDNFLAFGPHLQRSAKPYSPSK